MRAERFEVVDAGGAVRAVLGPLGGDALGLALFGPDGREQVRLAVDAEASALTVVAGGNIVLEAGWLEPVADVVRGGGYLFLADERGTPVVGWRIGADGRVSRLDPPRR